LSLLSFLGLPALLNAASGGPLQGFNRVKFQVTGYLEHGCLFFDDERAYAIIQAKAADKGGRSTTEEMPYSLNLAIST